MTIVYTFIIGIVILGAVVGATLVAISKGYKHQHTIDPHPNEKQEDVNEKDH